MSSPWKDFPNNKTERPFEGIPAGQEPEVMPGVTAPATGPWPPLSREQVVELHEALIEFLKAPMEAPNRLAMKLLALGIGTPPQPRRWTNDDIQAALEKREEPTASLVSSPLGVKHNCGTCQKCKHWAETGVSRMGLHGPCCRLMAEHLSKGKEVAEWFWNQNETVRCPGWEPKP